MPGVADAGEARRRPLRQPGVRAGEAWPYFHYARKSVLSLAPKIPPVTEMPWPSHGQKQNSACGESPYGQICGRNSENLVARTKIIVGPLGIEFHEQWKIEEIRRTLKGICGAQGNLATQSMDKRTSDLSPNGLRSHVQPNQLR